MLVTAAVNVSSHYARCKTVYLSQQFLWSLVTAVPPWSLGASMVNRR